MSITVTIHTSSNTCEGTAHVGSRIATTANPVIRIRTEGEYMSLWRCAQCLKGAVANKGASAETQECTECDATATKCEDHASVTCYNCGTTLGGDTRAFCDAQCALSAGYDGGHECECEESHCSWCSNCGEEAYYCSADCALASGSEAYCSECGNAVTIPDHCPKCLAKPGITGSPETVKAASNVATNDDGAITIDGIEIRF